MSCQNTNCSFLVCLKTESQEITSQQHRTFACLTKAEWDGDGGRVQVGLKHCSYIESCQWASPAHKGRQDI